MGRHWPMTGRVEELRFIEAATRRGTVGAIVGPGVTVTVTAADEAPGETPDGGDPDGGTQDPVDPADLADSG